MGRGVGGVQIRSWDNCGWLWSHSGGGMGQGSGLQRTLKNCKFPLHHLNMCPAELTERREWGARKRKKSVLHSQMILIWCGLECNLDQTQPCKWVRVFIIRCLWRGVERGRARTAEVGVASRPRIHWRVIFFIFLVSFSVREGRKESEQAGVSLGKNTLPAAHGNKIGHSAPIWLVCFH